MPEQFGERTHEATQHRRDQARREGQTPRSHDLASALQLVVALALLLYLGSGMAEWLASYTQEQLGGAAGLTLDEQLAAGQMNRLFVQLATALLPMLGLLLLVAVVVNLGQVGFMFLPEKLAFDASRVSPLKGMQRILSLSNTVRLVLGIFKIIIVMAVAVWALWDSRDEILELGALTVPEIAHFISTTTLWICLKIAAALVVLAIIDYAYQYWKHEQDLRMTHQEMREEMRNTQGDPQIIARRRSIQRQLVMNRLQSTVPKADVVVTNPTELAIAIQYDHETMEAPIVLAKGAGVVAQRIRRLALENGIPIVERKELARALYKQVEINQQIPAAQYAAVAEVLKYVYQLKGKKLA